MNNWCICWFFTHILTKCMVQEAKSPVKNLVHMYTYLLHGAESFLRSWPVFAASQETPCIFMEPKSSLSYSQVPATRPYPEPTTSSPHHPLQLPEDSS